MNGSVARLAYGPLRLRVLARPEPLRWVEEFLSPWFGGAAWADCDATVLLHEDTPQYDARVAAWAGDRGLETDCFINDSHVIRLPTAPTADGVTAWQQEFAVFYEVDRRRREIAIVSKERNASARTALMRVVRELAMNHALLTGGTFLHAAACAVKGRVMLIAGEKHAGKSTLLLYLLRETGADYLSNDRVLVPTPQAATVRGMPTIVALRAPTLGFFPALQAAIESRSFQFARTMAEAAANPRPVRPGRDGRYSLSPAQLCALLGARPVAEGTASVLLLPRVTGDATAGNLRELTPDETADRLRAVLLSAGVRKKTSDLLSFPGDLPSPVPERVEAALHAFADRVRCVECRLGTRAYESAGLARECVSLLGGLGAGG